MSSVRQKKINLKGKLLLIINNNNKKKRNIIVRLLDILYTLNYILLKRYE